jgi:polysaccharide export outer membrane protein
MAPPDAAQEVARRLSEGYLRNPQVTITLKSFTSKRIYILGAVQKPGSVVFRHGFTIVQLISEAGGFAETADKDDVRLTRRVGREQRTFLIPVDEITSGEAPDFSLSPGDVVFVPQRIF